MRQKIEVQAMLDEDVRAILDDFGLLHDFEAHKLTCMFCKEIITWQNLGGVLVRGSGLLVFCGSPICINETSAQG